MLTLQEQAEYDRQQLELQNPKYHDWAKCGQKLLPRRVRKKKGKRFVFLNRLYCPAHHLYVDTSGWQIGFAYGQESKSFIKNK